MANERVKMECPECGYKSVPQWLNDEAHCLKCQAVLKTRGTRAPPRDHRRAPGEVSTFKHAAGSAMESSSGVCDKSPDGHHHWKFGKCTYCHMSEGKLLGGAGAVPNPGGADDCPRGGKCMFKFGKCTKCGRVEGVLDLQPRTRRPRRSQVGDRVVELFKKFDLNGDGTIDKGELKTILLLLYKGEFTDAQIEASMAVADKNGDGQIDYDEWASWVASDGAHLLNAQDERPAPAPTRAAPAAAHVLPAAEEDCQDIQKGFEHFTAGSRDMDGKTFVKVCKDTGLVDKKFTATDVDLIFAKVVTKGQRRIDFQQFRNGLRLIAEKKGMDIDDIESLVALSRGPVLTGTQAEAVRFHDDKSSYTGVYARGGPESVAKGTGTAADSWKLRN
eukprot:TRINITY_DN41060_c0_g1_i1.p1 TRINITY_DN41060_c0_g1~~TRINITY_DN41060_c0_g1_i1.p1  ORF type:complete len:388 (+),score=66.73 TRINITY_DN41060_c0_g1_i1:48-1211(+)